MIKKFEIALIDTNNLFRRSYESLKHRGFQGEELYKKSIKQTLISIKKLQRDYLWSFATLYFLFDNHDSKINLRAELSDRYKKDRIKMPNAYYKYLDYLKTMLLSYDDNFRIVYVDYLEADDLVISLLDYLEHKSTVLISADLDWSRTINYNNRDIVWYNFQKVYDKNEFKERFGFYPSVQKIILYKCLTGDASDGIPKVLKGLGKEAIIKLCQEYNDIEDVYIYRNKIDYLSQKMKYKIEENINILRTHKKLIQFININNFGNISDFIHKSSYKPKELKLFYMNADIDLKFDDRLYYIEREREIKSLFKLDKLPRKDV